VKFEDRDVHIPRLHCQLHTAANQLETTAMDSNTNEADVILNRTNIALARSNRILQSWLKSRPEDEHTQAADEQLDISNDFESMSETAGVGSKAAENNDDLLSGLRPGKLRSTDDALLEQLLGKKAAQARRKAQAVDKNASGAKRVHEKPADAASRRIREETSNDEEEVGRAAHFTAHRSLKSSSGSLRKTAQQPASNSVSRPVDGQTDDVSENDVASPIPKTNSRLHKSPPKRKSGSYLDEILAQKAMKKSKKKNG
jgi:hypothetical protein